MEEPEVIVIEEKGEYEEQRFDQSFESLKMKKQFPWFAHVLFALASCVLAFLIVAVAFLLAFVGVMNIFSFFQVKPIRHRFLATFKLWKKFFAFLVGTLVGIFNPAFGVGIIAIYLLQQGDNIQDQFIFRAFN